MTSRSRYAAYALCIDGGRILLTRIWENDPGAGKWTLPGGKIEWLEDPATAVHRELWEEAGLAGEIIRPVGVDTRVFPPWRGHGELHTVRFVFEVRTTGTPEVKEVDSSTVDAAWFDLADLDSIDTTTLVTAALAMLETVDLA